MRTRLVLFDIDGTLIRTGGAGVKAFAQTAEHIFGKPGGTRAMRFHGRTDVSLVREFFRNHGIADTPDSVQQFLDAYVQFLDEQLRHHRGEVCPGIRELLAALGQHAESPVVGLLTGNIRRGAGLKLRAHGLASGFLMGAFGDDHEDRNELARIALARGSALLGDSLVGEEVVVVGDTRADIECARAIGARCIAVATGGETLPSLLEHSPALAVESLAEVSVERIFAVGQYREQSTDWEALYHAGDTRWDKGEAAPGLRDFLRQTPNLAGQRVLVPGCGRGHDARAWAEAGCRVVALDVAPAAISEAQALTPARLETQFECDDFLREGLISEPFDWIFEHTLWCALSPTRRADYVRAVTESVRTGGHYLAINYLQPSDEVGPPFGVTVAELRERWREAFELVRDWVPRSYPSRAGRERMFLWRRRTPKPR
ncbi:MAG TPA: HAD hydrolase-like protein [Verrucomicrobiota bacterium]|nr:hypothetical protein [Verrucomicrobiales bacterium]HRI13463.1 HAD hydrolase-like protein [Verrucomicrobiota bacterium]